MFSENEFEQILFGEDQLDMRAWESHTQYQGGYKKECDMVKWFWTVVLSFSAAEQGQLLEFCRGSSSLPPGGFASLMFILRRSGDDSGRLPEAHTCEFSLDLPPYATKMELEAKLRRAMVEQTFGRA